MVDHPLRRVPPSPPSASAMDRVSSKSSPHGRHPRRPNPWGTLRCGREHALEKYNTVEGGCGGAPPLPWDGCGSEEALQEHAWRRTASTWRVAAARRLEKVVHSRLGLEISCCGSSGNRGRLQTFPHQGASHPSVYQDLLRGLKNGNAEVELRSKHSPSRRLTYDSSCSHVGQGSKNERVLDLPGFVQVLASLQDKHAEN